MTAGPPPSSGRVATGRGAPPAAEPLRRQHALDDLVLSVLSAGEEVDDKGDDEPLLFLHGIPTGAELWRDVLRAVAVAGRRGYAPDLPGYGLTRVPLDADFSLAGGAEVVAAWLQAEGIGPCWIVGHDLGGAVAQILAVRHPDLVSRLTLTNCVAGDVWPVPQIRLLRLLARARLYAPLVRRRLVRNSFARYQLARAFADPDRLGDIDATRVFWDTKVGSGRRAFAEHLRALSSDDTERVTEDLTGLDVPCQVVWGVEDTFLRWDDVGRLLVDLLPDPHVVQLEDCGHFTPLECPDAFTRALLDWTRRP